MQEWSIKKVKSGVKDNISTAKMKRQGQYFIKLHAQKNMEINEPSN